MNFIQINFIVIISIICVNGISVPVGHYDLIKLRCFNRSRSTGNELILGQNEPIGISMDNLISMIEKFEKLNPIYKPEKVIEIFLKRFHLDGVRFDGMENIPSEIQMHQSKVINAILGNNHESYSDPFPEHQFTEDEKCNLFFTISHCINDTATANENQLNIVTINEPPMARMGAPNLNVAPPSIRDMGNEIPLITTTEESNDKKSESKIKVPKRTKREIRLVLNTLKN